MRILALSMISFLWSPVVLSQAIGFSGMDQLNDSTFIVVCDLKAHEEGSRIARLSVNQNGYVVKELEIKDWKHAEGRASDLESICSIPNKDNEFYAIEAGYWNGQYGRVFHIEVVEDEVIVRNTYRIPALSPGGENNREGDNFEGAVCIENNGKAYLVLGERGGTTRCPNGILRIGLIDEKNHKIDWKTNENKFITIKAPELNQPGIKLRSITDLYLTENNVLLASAAVDISDSGPFKSVIYEIGEVYFENDDLKIKRSNNTPRWTIDGFKVEAISSPPKNIKGGKISIGTEDENYPGVWRVLK